MRTKEKHCYFTIGCVCRDFTINSNKYSLMASNDTMMIDETSPSSFSSSSSVQSSEYSSSSTLDKPTIERTKSNKRKSMLTINGYHFQMKNYNKKKILKFWRLANRNCRVLLHNQS